MERLKPHDLLRVRGSGAVYCEEPGAPLPEWSAMSLWRAPWVVVRRAYAPAANSIPVGVRGSTRGERLAAFVDRTAIVERLSPEELLAVGRGRSMARTPALRVLGELDELLCGHSWGPTGSAGFELASKVPTTSLESDLDLVIRAPTPLPLAVAGDLSESLAALAVRVDAQLDTPSGTVLLEEYARGREVLVRTADGPELIRCPWQMEALERQAGGRIL